MECILCRVVESSCLPTHNIVPHTSLHDQPCRKTMKKYEDFEGMVISLHGSVIVHSIFAYLTLSLSAAQVYVIQERIKILFLSSQFYVIHIHR